jgi:hypothetical protein
MEEIVFVNSKICILVESKTQTVMTKIEAINFQLFSNQEHFRFMSDFDHLVSMYPAAVMGMEVLYGVFHNTLMAEELALRVEQGSSISQKLEQLDNLRDKAWNAINLRVKATLLSPFEEEVQSAQVIKRIIKRYGKVCSMTYSEQSMAVENLTNELLLAVNEVHLDRIGFASWVIELKNQNQEFLEIYNERNADFAGRESGEVKAARTLLDPVYKQLVEKINASIILEFARPEVINFINKLNENIKTYQTTIVMRNVPKVETIIEEKV